MIIDVFFDESVFICQGKECTECAPIASSGVLRKLEFLAVDSFCSGEVFTESVAEVYCEVVKRAVASCVVLEMFIYDCPFLVVVFEDGFKVGEYAHLAGGLVKEAVLFVDYCEFPLGADSFGLLHFLGIDSAFVWGSGISI